LLLEAVLAGVGKQLFPDTTKVDMRDTVDQLVVLTPAPDENIDNV